MTSFTPTFSGIGIDPGAVNLGWAVVKRSSDLAPFKVHILSCYTDNPRAAPKLEDYVKERSQSLTTLSFYEAGQPSFIMERFVPYGGNQTDIMEEVNQLIGMFRLAMSYQSIDTELHRAIEWKTTLVKLLNKHCGFENPSKNGALDKTFSLAAARFISLNPDHITNDHEADAVCLAALPYLIQASKLAILEAKQTKAQPK